MKRCLGLIVATWMLACTGAQGAMGKPGDPGPAGNGTPSVSAVTPPYAFLGRTVDLTIAGNATGWSSATTVAFADPGVKVNKVTAASATGLLVNVTIGSDATVGTTNVTVTDGKTMEVYKGAFQIEAPLLVTVDPPAGVPQGGLADVHVQMLDTTTPFDPDTTMVTLSSPDVALSQPTLSDYAFDLTIEADVLAATGTFDLDVTSGAGGSAVDSLARKALTIAARTPTALSSTAKATGVLTAETDTKLYTFAPSSAAQQFLQFSIASVAGEVMGTVIPKSGKYADAIASGFLHRYGQGTTSTDPFYVVVGDADDPLGGPGPVPADESVVTFAAPCTAVSETPESAASNNDAPATAQAVTTPVLVSGTLGYGSVDPASDVDVYAITVTGAPRTIHAATGGDPLDDTVISILAATGNDLADSDDQDYQEDLVYTAATDGTYYVRVAPSPEAFQASDNTYQLFIEIE